MVHTRLCLCIAGLALAMGCSNRPLEELEPFKRRNGGSPASGVVAEDTKPRFNELLVEPAVVDLLPQALEAPELTQQRHDAFLTDDRSLGEIRLSRDPAKAAQTNREF